ncbi:NERD domain-containing protein [Oceanobacillus halophilus]|uniref:NERD domain-containing protein n=1 Tax=Oceanobacillus halophilus TaxID=930130 RepID=UPI001F4DF4D8|nr:NERD domain-containing protein [Oceanobacillus halophilus]
MYRTWSNPELTSLYDEEHNQETTSVTSKFSKLKTFIQRNQKVEVEQENQKELTDELPNTEEELKHYFLDKILPFQLKWATSTVNRISYVHKKYYTDPLLKYFLQRFPDTYLLMYFPVFTVKNAPIDGEILLISPLGIEILYVIEEDSQAIVMAGNERSWTVEQQNDFTKMINPTIALKRTEHIIKSILQKYEVDFPIYKTVISRTNSILYTTEPYQTRLIGKDEYKEWFEKRRKLRTTLKNRQLKAAEVLLHHCQSTSVQRPEWEEDISLRTIGEMGE